MVIQRCDEENIAMRMKKGFGENARDFFRLSWKFCKEHKFLIGIIIAFLMILVTIIGAMADDFSLDSKNSITIVKGVQGNVFSVGITNLQNKTLDVNLYSKNNAMNPLSKEWVSFENGKKSTVVNIFPNQTEYVQFNVIIPSDIDFNSYTGQIDFMTQNQTESYVFTINYIPKGSTFDTFVFYGAIGLIIFFFAYAVKRTFFP